MTLQTCGLQAPAAAARPLACPPARPEPPARRDRRTPACPAPRPPASSVRPGRPCVELSPARGRRLCAALTQLVLGGGGGGRSHVAPGSERGRGGRPARGARGRRRAVSRRAVPQGPGAALGLSRGPRCALEARPPPASSALRASLSPRLASSRLGSSLSLAPLRSRRRRPCGRVTAWRLFGSAPGLLASRPLLYLERAEPSSPLPLRRPLARPPSLARSLARASSCPPAAAKLPPARSGDAASQPHLSLIPSAARTRPLT